MALTRGGMLLIALLSGNDYNPVRQSPAQGDANLTYMSWMQSGLAKFGPRIAQRLAHAGLGDELLSAAINLPIGELKIFLSTWRQDLRKELSKRRLRSLANSFQIISLRSNTFVSLRCP